MTVSRSTWCQARAFRSSKQTKLLFRVKLLILVLQGMKP